MRIKSDVDSTEVHNVPDLANASVIGRLLEEVSWEGRTVKRYRYGGRGFENVLTAEVLLPLGYLPRRRFLGAVVQCGHGADAARARLLNEVEDVTVTLLPDESYLGADRLVVQPDAVMESPGCHVLVEAKRIRQASFQPEQLSREYLALKGDAGEKCPLLLVILAGPPPVPVRGHGRLGLVEAVRLHLPAVLARTQEQAAIEELHDAVPDRVAWITWAEIRQVVVDQTASMPHIEASLRGTVERLSSSLTKAVDWHT